MDFEFEDVGILRASCEKGLYRMALDVDPAIAEYARSLIPAYHRVQKPKFPPHMSVVRQREPLVDFERFSGEVVSFRYAMGLHNDDTYWWLIADSQRLREIRSELGPPELAWCCRPPDDTECFHITVANTKTV